MAHQNIAQSSAKVDSNRRFITPAELFALLLCIALIFIFAWYRNEGYLYAYDFTTYLWAGDGDLHVHYYAFWILPLFKLLVALPPMINFILWNLLNLAGVFFAVKVFSGKIIPALLTYQMFYTLYYGNIVGILIGGLALLWWGMKHRRWHLAGAGLIIACTKYQLGATVGLFIWLLAPVTWQQRLRVLIIPVAIFFLSLTIYPLWPIDSFKIITQNPPVDLGSISLWQWIGPLALLLWIPPLILPLGKQSRLITLTATTALATPYFQQTDLLALFVMPVGWMPLLGNIAFYFFAKYEHIGLKAVVIVPLLIYIWQLTPAVKRWFVSKK